MRLVVTIELDNLAFSTGGAGEVARILGSLSGKLPDPLRCFDPLHLYDMNGNRCGVAQITDAPQSTKNPRPPKWHGNTMD